MKQKNYILALTGASGSIYGKIILEELLRAGHRVYLVYSKIAVQVWAHEIEGDGLSSYLKSLPAEWQENLFTESNADLGAIIASGSFRHDGMIVAPCSMKTLAAVAHGLADNLIGRAADVALKERFPLALLLRETPFSLIHIENMAHVARAGGIIIPANPGFYHGDDSFEGLTNFVAGKVLDTLRIEHQLYKRWKQEDAGNTVVPTVESPTEIN